LSLSIINWKSKVDALLSYANGLYLDKGSKSIECLAEIEKGASKC